LLFVTSFRNFCTISGITIENNPNSPKNVKILLNAKFNCLKLTLSIFCCILCIE
jgi:hypothetical protein